MTIDGYLNQARALKRKADRAEEKLSAMENKAGPRSCLNLGDGIYTSNNGGNTTEAKLIEYTDAAKKWRKATSEYKQFRDQLQQTIKRMPYWAALTLEQIYIFNVFWDRDNDLFGVEEILETTDRREILAKLKEAKALLADELRTQGVEIEKTEQ